MYLFVYLYAYLTNNKLLDSVNYEFNMLKAAMAK